MRSVCRDPRRIYYDAPTSRRRPTRKYKINPPVQQREINFNFRMCIFLIFFCTMSVISSVCVCVFFFDYHQKIINGGKFEFVEYGFIGMYVLKYYSSFFFFCILQINLYSITQVRGKKLYRIFFFFLICLLFFL